MSLFFFQENGNIVRESDKREEIYFEKGQTKQLVEQWKSKQISPERDTPDAQAARDAEILQQGLWFSFYSIDSRIVLIIGKAKNLMEKWQTRDKENTPPPERRGLRAITPPADHERRSSIPVDVSFLQPWSYRSLRSIGHFRTKDHRKDPAIPMIQPT